MRAAPRRSDDWTEPLRGRGDWLDAVLDDVQVRVLDDSPPTPDERAALFGSAAAVFAARAQPDADPGTVAVPEPPAVLASPAFTSPLLVSVAAYLAVHDPDGKVPTSRADLLAELVAHEDRYWQATARAHQVEVGDEDLRRRVVAVITLAGADTESEAADLLGLLPDLSDPSSRPGVVMRWPAGEGTCIRGHGGGTRWSRTCSVSTWSPPSWPGSARCWPEFCSVTTRPR